MVDTTTTGRSADINISVSLEMIDLIDRAAQIHGKTRADFMLDTLRKAAEDAVLDQRLFVLDPVQWEAFIAALDAPPNANPQIKALLGRTPVWEK